MEPRWTDLPPQPTALPHLPLERVKVGTILEAIITTNTVLGVWTHFMGGRTLACLAENCPGCSAQLPRRWEGYLGCWTKKPNRHIIAALTPGAALGINDTAADPHNLRGLWLLAERIGRRANSRLKARTEAIELAQIKLPPEPDLKAHLLHIWGLDQAHVSADNPGYANRVQDFYRGNGKPTDEQSIP